MVGNSRNQPHAASDRLLEPLCETSSTSLTDLLYYSGVERCKLDSTSGSRHTKSAHCNQQLLSVAAHSYLALVSGTLMERKEVTLLPCTLHSQSAETQDECICNEMLCPATGQPHIRGTETEMTHFLPASWWDCGRSEKRGGGGGRNKNITQRDLTLFKGKRSTP